MSRDSTWRRVAGRALGRAQVTVPDPIRADRPDDDATPRAVESICRAPSVSMYFDQFGKVRACCQNTGTLMGDVSQQSIREIWGSRSTRRLRAALQVGDLSEGCGFCQWQVDQGDEDILFARVFDDLPLHGDDPDWPVQMEFSMTNSCNLQCAMCNGDWSSSIRAHREQRPPLPEVYTDAFFDELAEFLPHLTKTNFLGGEPFLGKEPLRVLSMLADLDQPPDVAVTTNGTQWSPRIEAICERLPISFVVSLDGITQHTYESIRVGADFDTVMANIERFQAYAARHGTNVTLAHCLMRPNWHEFSRLLRFAEDRGLDVGMNEVLFPVELSLFQLPADELRDIVTAMRDDPLAEELSVLRPVWDGQLGALQHRLEVLDGGDLLFIQPWRGRAGAGDWGEEAVATLTEWVGDEPPIRVVADPSAGTMELVGARAYVLDPLGAIDPAAPMAVVAALASQLGPDTPVERPDSSFIHDLVVGREGPEAVQYRVVWGSTVGQSTMYVAVRNPPPPPVLPDDVLTMLLEWSGADQVLVLHCDELDHVTSIEGSPGVIHAERADQIVGRTTGDLFLDMQSEFGEVDLRPGPSGEVYDTIVTFSKVDRDPLLLRVLVISHHGAVVMFIGTAPVDRDDR